MESDIELDQTVKSDESLNSKLDLINNGMSESRKKLFSAWHSEFFKNGRLNTRIAQVQPETFVEAPEPELIEIPDEIAVSPSQLSDIDDDFSSKALFSSVEHLGMFNCESIDQSSIPKNFKFRCPCLSKSLVDYLIRCKKCKTWQHLNCLLVIYDNHNNYIKTYHDLSVRRKSSYFIPSIDNINNRGTCKSLQDAEMPYNRLLPPITVDDFLCDICAKIKLSRNLLAPSNRSKLSDSDNSIVHDVPVETSSQSEMKLNQSIIDQVAASSASKILALQNAEIVLKKNELKTINAVKKNIETTLINQRVPSPPRKSKRKQTIAAKSYNYDSPQTIKSEELESPRKPYDTSSLMNDEMEKLTSQALVQSSTANIANCRTGHPFEPPFSHRENDAKKKRMMPPEPEDIFQHSYVNTFCRAFQNTYSDQILNNFTALIDKDEKTYPSRYCRSTNYCLINSENKRIKGIETTISISSGDLILEVIGEMMTFPEYTKVHDPYKSFNPYSFIYSNIKQTIVINTMNYGNDARFIRRSCNPNCTLTHSFVLGKLHLFIKAIMDINAGVEMTLPFDIDYTTVYYPLECGCERKRCNVNKWNRRLLRYQFAINQSPQANSEINALSVPKKSIDPLRVNNIYNSVSVVDTGTSGKKVVNSLVNSMNKENNLDKFVKR